MEGPYRDLGAGFARLMGVEGLRRSPRHLRSVEDAVLELLRNSRDAGARNVYVATTLKDRRYRSITVIDDGRGIPETHRHLIFEPGVTTRHLEPVREADRRDLPHGAGLSLHHIREASLSAEVLSASSPTALKVVFDTEAFPEKSLQSTSRPSRSNLPATLIAFADRNADPASLLRLYHASPAQILTRLLIDRIIQLAEGEGEARSLRAWAREVGLELSLRTVQRVLAGEVRAAESVGAGSRGGFALGEGARGGGRNVVGGPILTLGEGDLAEVFAVLRRAARASYLDVAGLVAEKRPGEVVVRARVYEPEDEYE